MENQDNASKPGQNWKTLALVAAVLLAGAVMGHSLLTNGSADSGNAAVKSACQTCPASQAFASQEAAVASMVSSDQTKGSCCAKKTGCCESDAPSEAGCCAQKPTDCCGGCETCQAKSGCGGCSSSTDTQ